MKPNIMIRDSGRGMLTSEIQEVSKNFLGREITIDELRLMPFLDYTLKNFNSLGKDSRGRPKINSTEREILTNWENEGHVLLDDNNFMVTKEFYNFLQEVLWGSYVELYLKTRELAEQLIETHSDDLKLMLEVENDK